MTSGSFANGAGVRDDASVVLRGGDRELETQSHRKRPRCSFRMHRSITTKIPAWRAFSAAFSWMTSSCIQTAGTFELNGLIDHFLD